MRFTATIAALISLYEGLILLRALASWFAPDSRHPAVELLARLTEPVLAPIRRALPPTSGIDFSPLVALLGLELLKRLLT